MPNLTDEQYDKCVIRVAKIEAMLNVNDIAGALKQLFNEPVFKVRNASALTAQSFSNIHTGQIKTPRLLSDVLELSTITEQKSIEMQDKSDRLEKLRERIATCINASATKLKSFMTDLCAQAMDAKYSGSENNFVVFKTTHEGVNQLRKTMVKLEKLHPETYKHSIKILHLYEQIRKSTDAIIHSPDFTTTNPMVQILLIDVQLRIQMNSEQRAQPLKAQDV